MAYAVIRGENGRRHHVDFEDAPICVEIHASDEIIEIFVEADWETYPPDRRRFVMLEHSAPPIQQSVGQGRTTNVHH
jgi:hypothetical protein